MIWKGLQIQKKGVKMNPINFPEENFTWGVPKGAEHSMRPLPCFVEWGEAVIPGKGKTRVPINTLSLWELSDEEIDWIVQNRKIWLKQHNAGNPLQAQLMIAGPVEFPKPYAFCLVNYRAVKSLKGFQVYVADNIEIPTMVSKDGELYEFDEKYAPRFVGPGFALNIDDYFFRTPHLAEAASRSKAVAIEWMESEAGKNASPEESEAMREKIMQNSFSMPLLCQRLQAGKEQIIC
jgi:hypothetical protein